MGENTDILNFEDQLLTLLLKEEQIKTGQYPKSELFYLKWNELELGPFWQFDLQEHFKRFPKQRDLVLFRSEIDDNWSELKSHPSFRKSAPKLQSSQTLTPTIEHFFVLINGQKHGPYKDFEISKMLQNGELGPNDVVSSDEGHNWGKVYQIDDFREAMDSMHTHLPHLPDRHDYEVSFQKEELSRKQCKERKNDTLFGLAYMGNIKGVREHLRESPISEEEYEVPKEVIKFKYKFNYKKSLVYASPVFVLIIIGVLLVPMFDNTEDMTISEQIIESVKSSTKSGKKAKDKKDKKATKGRSIASVNESEKAKKIMRKSETRLRAADQKEENYDDSDVDYDQEQPDNYEADTYAESDDYPEDNNVDSVQPANKQAVSEEQAYEREIASEGNEEIEEYSPESAGESFAPEEVPESELLETLPQDGESEVEDY